MNVFQQDETYNHCVCGLFDLGLGFVLQHDLVETAVDEGFHFEQTLSVELEYRRIVS